jgi:hypothetical protein
MCLLIRLSCRTSFVYYSVCFIEKRLRLTRYIWRICWERDGSVNGIVANKTITEVERGKVINPSGLMTANAHNVCVCVLPLPKEELYYN